jgi:hypothetical protein
MLSNTRQGCSSTQSSQKQSYPSDWTLILFAAHIKKYKKVKKVNKKAITIEYEKLTSEITSLLQLGSTQVSIDTSQTYL